jgi:16S rRNA (cytosine1402-N4)-methyltransferase
MIANGHVSVLKEPVLEFLSLRYPGKFLDMTFGGGGHTRAILGGNEKNFVVSVDCDPEAALRSKKLTEDFPGRFSFVDGFFDEAFSDKKILEEKFDGVLFDLGVSSFQLDTMQRGFSFRADAEADMRMNPRVGIPAWKFIQDADEATLTMVVRDWAEEPRWRNVVRVLVEKKYSPEIKSTLGLASLLTKHALHSGRIHPATRVFMGLRMAVNQEIERLRNALPKAFSVLSSGGILAVISFHSIEDRVAKEFFREVTKQGARKEEKQNAQAKLLIKKVGRPTSDEKKENARARSAKLRVLQKI